jgi:hypothetical protein
MAESNTRELHTTPTQEPIMLYPLIIATLANEQLEESRRHGEKIRRIRQARAENRAARQALKARRHLRLVTPRVAEPATRIPR